MLSLDRGRVVAAFLGRVEGLAALDAIVLTLPNAEFGFSSSGPPCAQPNIAIGATEMKRYLLDLAKEAAVISAAIPSLAVTPRVVTRRDAAAPGGPVLFDRRRLRLLLAVDGRRTVEQLITAEGDRAAGLRALTWLVSEAFVQVSISTTEMPASARAGLDERAAAAVARAAIPRLTVDLADRLRSTEPLRMDRSTLDLLLAVDGRRTVQEMLDATDPEGTLRRLGWLESQGLICVDVPATESTPAREDGRDAPPPSSRAADH